MENLERIIDVGRGLVRGDLLLKNCRIVNVFSSKIEEANVIIANKKIVGIGDYEEADTIIDLEGAYLLPGFIDAHVHVESSMLTPFEFARAVGPLGVTSAIVDPHEIANVLGHDGIKFMLESSKNNHISLYFMLPSCVPATHMETSGATLLAEDIGYFMEKKWVKGLGEVMNYPGVLAKETQILEKIQLAKMKNSDGHAPGLSGKDLNAYVATGISTDHECLTPEEAMEKLARGMRILIREGSGAKNLDALIGIVTPQNCNRFMFCTDDRHPEDLANHEHINYSIRRAVEMGLDPMSAVKMATINVAEHYNIPRKGAIAPGYWADLVVVNDFKHFDIKKVFRSGELIAENYTFLARAKGEDPVNLRGSVNVGYFDRSKLTVADRGKSIRVINLIADQIVTTESIEAPTVVHGNVVSDPARDLLKIAVIERHMATGNVSVGFVRGFGLKHGAIASTVSHDSHNIIVVGVSDDDMERAVQELILSQGGKIVIDGGETKALLPLPIGGLMSRLGLPEVAAQKRTLEAAARALGTTLTSPFMTLSFLALPVIPHLKITDQGLVDVIKFDFVPLFVE
ncbi:adenine deaminase [Myxococcota bacterium]|nr:adenine deaminase [Myxococcota bacterium]MBU1536190.1 adenine deaminase [Myxococcota bacterium]